MSDEHELIQESLAAYALHTLDGDELVQVERLLGSHLPHCRTCRDLLEGFEAAAGELGLAAPAQDPPHAVWVRIRRDLRRRGGARWAAGITAAVALALVAGLGTWSALLSHRVGAAEDQQARTTELLAVVSDPASHVVPLFGEGSQFTPVRLAATYIPGHNDLYLFGSVPAPRPDHVYQVWLVRAGEYSGAGTFVPDRGHVLVRLSVDPSSYDGLLITEEPPSGSHKPSQHRLGGAHL